MRHYRWPFQQRNSVLKLRRAEATDRNSSQLRWWNNFTVFYLSLKLGPIHTVIERQCFTLTALAYLSWQNDANDWMTKLRHSNLISIPLVSRYRLGSNPLLLHGHWNTQTRISRILRICSYRNAPVSILSSARCVVTSSSESISISHRLTTNWRSVCCTFGMTWTRASLTMHWRVAGPLRACVSKVK